MRTFVNPALIDPGYAHGAYRHGSHRRHIEPRATIRTVTPRATGRRTPVRVDGSGVRCSPFYGQEIRIVRPCEVAVPLRMSMGY